MRTTRRSYLAALGGAATIGATAGCLGGSGGSGSLPDGCDVGTLDSVSSLPRPALGPEDAAVTVDVFEDFACGHCRSYTLETYPEVKSTYIDPGEIRYRYFDLPVPVDEEWSYRAASAARAVQDRSDAETFFTFAKGVYENQNSLSEEGYQIVHDLAEEAGIDGCTVAAAAKQEPYREVVEADRETGKERGAPGTPAIFVDGELLEAYDWGTVDAAISDSLETSN